MRLLRRWRFWQWRENVWPEYRISSFRNCKLSWQFFYWYLGCCLFVDRTFRASAVGLLFGIVFDINRVGGQGVSWYVRLFHQKFELVATASAKDSYLVVRISWIARRLKAHNTVGIRSRPERLRWRENEQSEWQWGRPASEDEQDSVMRMIAYPTSSKQKNCLLTIAFLMWMRPI